MTRSGGAGALNAVPLYGLSSSRTAGHIIYVGSSINAAVAQAPLPILNGLDTPISTFASSPHSLTIFRWFCGPVWSASHCSSCPQGLLR